MIETTKIWETDLYGADPTIQRELQNKYGSKRSGTIYIVATTQDEAQQIIHELFTRNGYTPLKKVLVQPTHLVKQALRMIQ